MGEVTVGRRLWREHAFEGAFGEAARNEMGSGTCHDRAGKRVCEEFDWSARGRRPRSPTEPRAAPSRRRCEAHPPPRRGPRPRRSCGRRRSIVRCRAERALAAAAPPACDRDVATGRDAAAAEAGAIEGDDLEAICERRGEAKGHVVEVAARAVEQADRTARPMRAKLIATPSTVTVPTSVASAFTKVVSAGRAAPAVMRSRREMSPTSCSGRSDRGDQFAEQDAKAPELGTVHDDAVLGAVEPVGHVELPAPRARAAVAGGSASLRSRRRPILSPVPTTSSAVAVNRSSAPGTICQARSWTRPES